MWTMTAKQFAGMADIERQLWLRGLELTGSDKQIKWAKDIRQTFADYELKSVCNTFAAAARRTAGVTEADTDAALAEVIAEFDRIATEQTEAKWWINNQTGIYGIAREIAQRAAKALASKAAA